MPCSIKFCAVIVLLLSSGDVLTATEGEGRAHWLDLGQQDIKNALTIENIQGVAKNVIVFVGDGMGVTTLTASRIYSQGEGGYFSFEKFPHVGVLKTYSADKLVPDSCSAATALFCGVKANQKTTGVDATVPMDDCEASLKAGSRPESILVWAQQAGKSTGFVTTTRVTHATPSALYAHSPNRKWECENFKPANASKCKDIGRQLVEDEPGKNINVIMGGGRQCIESDRVGSKEDPIDTYACYSKDGRNLMKDWADDKKTRGLAHSVVTNNQELFDLDTKKTDFVLGVFSNGHIAMNYARDTSPKGMPSLSNMTYKAIEVLQKNPKGFLLMVEGGLIDFAHHRGHARQALDETVEFNKAIEVAIQKTNPKDTLIVVTSDHSHSLMFSGYAPRGRNILDIAQKSKIDLIPYTSLLYGTGSPENVQYEVANGSARRVNPQLNDTKDFEYFQQAAVLVEEATHSGDDVVVYANGPMAHLFHATHEQTFVAYVVGYAAKMGPFKDRNSGPVLSPAITLIALLSTLIPIVFR